LKPLNSTLGTFIVNLRTPKETSHKWIYFNLSSTGFRKRVQEKASTTTNISNISTSNLKEIELPFAPLSEQHRIVAKIEELFSELDKGVERHNIS
jgi:type I restriction enzyme S subunit